MDLAENMIRLSGIQGIEIIETGLRLGEKLYEELLVKTEELDKTDNSMIFIERDTPVSEEEINKKTVALVISASKMTGRVLQAAIREYLRQQQKNKNKSKMLL